MTKYWIAVACKEHVQNGKCEGIMQVCHGRVASLKRVKPGDWVIYYSPTEVYGQKAPYRMFTAIGQVLTGEPYQFKMSEDFIPWRRDVNFLEASDIAIQPLVDKLIFIKNKQHWGFVFRFGLIRIPEQDFCLIASAMGVKIGTEKHCDRESISI